MQGQTKCDYKKKKKNAWKKVFTCQNESDDELYREAQQQARSRIRQREATSA